jgi:hypothetical protein
VIVENISIGCCDFNITFDYCVNNETPRWFLFVYRHIPSRLFYSSILYWLVKVDHVLCPPLKHRVGVKRSYGASGIPRVRSVKRMNAVSKVHQDHCFTHNIDIIPDRCRVDRGIESQHGIVITSIQGITILVFHRCKIFTSNYLSIPSISVDYFIHPAMCDFLSVPFFNARSFIYVKRIGVTTKT